MNIRTHLRSAIIVLFGAVALLSASRVQANEAPKTASSPSVQLGAVAIPVIVDGQVVNYLHLNVKVNLTNPVSESVLRAREPYFRDVLIRTAYKTSFAQPGNTTELDVPKFKAAMMTAFTQVAGPNSIKSVDVSPKMPRKMAH